MTVVIRIIELATGVPDLERCGRYVKAYTPHGHGGQGHLVVTDDINEARGFIDALDALECWRSVSYTHPVRPDGMTNRPLTMWTIEMVPRIGGEP